MVDELRVRPAPGIRFPRVAPYGGFVGYQLATGDAQEDDLVIPSGPRYRLKDEPEAVPNITYYRRALARGDLENADEAPGAPEAEHEDEDDNADPNAHESEG